MKFARFSTLKRRSIILFHDSICILTAYYLAYTLRYESFYPLDFKTPAFGLQVFINFSVQSFVFFMMGVHRGIWRFASTSDLLLITRSVLLAVTSSAIAIFLLNRLAHTPRSIYILDALLLILFLSGGRIAYRILKQSASFRKGLKEDAILIGGGFAAEQLIRELKKNPQEIPYRIQCILDDNPKDQGQTLHGIPIVGAISTLPQAFQKYRPDIILIAIPSASSELMKRISKLAKPLGTKLRTLPPLTDLINGNVSFKQLRQVKVEDLMGRDVANLNLEQMASSHRGQTILITGAGGSIGSELSRQVLKYEPESLILLDHSELSIYSLKEEVNLLSKNTQLIFLTQSIRDRRGLENVFKTYRPKIIYHAAAYKHVPLMEENPLSAIKTNIQGTDYLCSLALEYEADRFTLISTDKAVNPTNVMGTTKRIAEMICQNAQEKGRTIFSMVRFGNVLGSSGSVIPKFKKQIASGGPVTITHPEITRYFMAIPEAAQLVIQAGCFAKGGEIFVLDMGEPVKILDLAKELITLSGREIDSEIKIEFTGLRPGEKLYEELLASTEGSAPTPHPLVRVAKSRPLCDHFHEQYEVILNLSPQVSKDLIKTELKKLVPEYQPQFNSHKKRIE